MNPTFDKNTCHDLAVAFAKANYKPKTLPNSYLQSKDLSEENLANFEGLYITAYQFFSRDREE